MILEWNVPFTIQHDDFADLDLNDDSGDELFLLVESGCEALRRLRVTVDEVPQADGQINHQRFTFGYEVALLIALWTDRENPACDADANSMAESLMLRLNRMLNDPGRLYWTPTGAGDQRILLDARLREIGPWTVGPAGDPRIQIRLDSPFPYVVDATEATANLLDGVPQILTNSGTVDFYPVVKVYGPTSFFTLENAEVGQSLIYDASLPGASAIGGGDYIEFDFFRNTAYLNGSGANRKAGIDVESSDFFVIQADSAGNTIEINGADADVLYSPAFA